MSLKKCRTCLAELEVYSDGKSKRGTELLKVIRSNKGSRRWDGNRCPACTDIYNTAKKRAAGSLPIDEVRNPKWVKARNSEKLVAAYLEGYGWSVALTTIRGPDLTASKGFLKCTMEVKSAFKAKAGDYWRVGYVDERRKNDDVVAIVFPGNVIYFTSMREHLSLCDKSGARNVTCLIRKSRSNVRPGIFTTNKEPPMPLLWGLGPE